MAQRHEEAMRQLQVEQTARKRSQDLQNMLQFDETPQT
jgi:hypothetical protein